MFTQYIENTLKYELFSKQSKTIYLIVIFLMKMHDNNKLTIFVIHFPF